MYLYYKQRIWHAFRFRNKRGFGVHSPYMFNFILNVLRDKKHIYKYPTEAEKMCNRHIQKKFHRLIFRVSNFLNVTHIAVFNNNNDILSAYVARFAPQLDNNDFTDLQSADLIIIQGEKATEVLQNGNLFFEQIGRKRQCIILTDIYKRKSSNQLWQQLRKQSKVNVDMMYYGVLLFDEKIQPGSYNLIL